MTLRELRSVLKVRLGLRRASYRKLVDVAEYLPCFSEGSVGTGFLEDLACVHFGEVLQSHEPPKSLRTFWQQVDVGKYGYLTKEAWMQCADMALEGESLTRTESRLLFNAFAKQRDW